MEINKYDIRLGEDRLPTLVKECAVVYEAKTQHDSPAAVAHWLETDVDMRHLAKETVLCLVYDIRQMLIGFSEISKGTSTFCYVSPRDIFQVVFALGGTSIIITHNHPSGCVTPLEDDFNMMKHIQVAGKYLDVRLLDFLIVGDNQYFSGAEAGLLEDSVSE